MDLLTKLSTLSTKNYVNRVEKIGVKFENTFRAICRKKTTFEKELTNEMSKNVGKFFGIDRLFLGKVMKILNLFADMD